MQSLASLPPGSGVTLVTKSQSETTFPGVVCKPIAEDDAWLQVELAWLPAPTRAVPATRYQQRSQPQPSRLCSRRPVRRHPIPCLRRTSADLRAAGNQTVGDPRAKDREAEQRQGHQDQGQGVVDRRGIVEANGELAEDRRAVRNVRVPRAMTSNRRMKSSSLRTPQCRLKPTRLFGA
jgi:hypothetical protein